MPERIAPSIARPVSVFFILPMICKTMRAIIFKDSSKMPDGGRRKGPVARHAIRPLTSML
jgi:hypothetical protein